MSKLDELIEKFCPNGVEIHSIEDVAEVARGVRVVRSQLADHGSYPVFQNSLTPMGYYEKKNCSADTAFVIAAGAASGKNKFPSLAVKLPLGFVRSSLFAPGRIKNFLFVCTAALILYALNACLSNWQGMKKRLLRFL